MLQMAYKYLHVHIYILPNSAVLSPAFTSTSRKANSNVSEPQGASSCLASAKRSWCLLVYVSVDPHQVMELLD